MNKRHQKYEKILKGCSPKFKDFFWWSIEILETHGKKLDIRNVSYLSLGGRHSGHCDNDEMVVARKSKLFEEIYVHEFSHMCQVIEESPFWTNVEDDIYHRIADCKIRVKDWEEMYKVILLERDCEQRVIKFSTKWNLFDNEWYSQRANTYLHFYQFIYLNSCWVSANTIYVKELINLMPKEILPMKYYKKIDMDIMMEYEKYLK